MAMRLLSQSGKDEMARGGDLHDHRWVHPLLRLGKVKTISSLKFQESVFKVAVCEDPPGPQGARVLPADPLGWNWWGRSLCRR